MMSAHYAVKVTGGTKNISKPVPSVLLDIGNFTQWAKIDLAFRLISLLILLLFSFYPSLL